MNALGNLTDDADRMVGGCDTFGPGDDYDPMYEGPGDGEPKCGGPRYEQDGHNLGCPGCRHCDPVDHECKPYGFGIERFEDPALLEANEFVATRVYLAGSMYRSPGGGWYETRDARMGERNRRWQANTRFDECRLRRSVRLWDRLCDECETHGEAVEKYSRWAAKVCRTVAVAKK